MYAVRNHLLALIVCGAVLSGASSARAGITWYFDFGGSDPVVPAAKLDAITASMNVAVDVYNQYSDYSWMEYSSQPRGIRVIYQSAVPTANAIYFNRISFGGSTGESTAIHEIAHVLGVGTFEPTWTGAVVGNKWQGPIANALLEEFDGAGSTLNADGTHFWPYGLNFSTEDSPIARERHVKMVGALRADMGLSDRTIVDTGISGDFNNDGIIDDADYAVFRNNLGQPVQLPNSLVSSTVIARNLTLWQDNYGRTRPAAVASIPEPAAAICLAPAGIVLLGRYRRYTA